jgi:uncharacterized protein YnzC (UPF0291/DUF896 family)
MKKSGLINLICALIVGVVFVVSVILVLVFTDIISVKPEKLVISSASASATYDGKPLIDDGWSLVNGELKDGHKLKVTVSGSQTNVGISENHLFVTILDENGADVTGDYDIEYRPGTLNVKQRPITIRAASLMKMVDGTPLSSDEYTIEPSIALLPEHIIEVKVEGIISEVGREDNIVTRVVIKTKSGEDVTRNYNVKTITGSLIIYDGATLVFESDTNQKAYDGRPLTDSDWRLVSGDLRDSHTVEVKVSGSQTELGTSDNTISVKIFDDNGRDVTGDYNIICNPGKLTVVQQEITVTSADGQKLYDQSPLVKNEFTVSPNFPEGFRVEPSITGSQTEPGNSKNNVDSYKVYDQNGNDVTDKFNVTVEEGDLTVYDGNEIPILTFQSGS